MSYTQLDFIMTRANRTIPRQFGVQYVEENSLGIAYIRIFLKARHSFADGAVDICKLYFAPNDTSVYFIPTILSGFNLSGYPMHMCDLAHLELQIRQTVDRVWDEARHRFPNRFS